MLSMSKRLYKNIVKLSQSIFSRKFSNLIKKSTFLPKNIYRSSFSLQNGPFKSYFVIRRNYTNRNILSLKERELVATLYPPVNPFPQKFIDLCNGAPQTIYAGFDPTADSLHVGHLAILMLLLHCQRAGHKVIALVGGGTALVGDPSDKYDERIQLEAEVVSLNTAKLKKNIKTIFENHEMLFWDTRKGEEMLEPVKIVNNMDWYKSFSIIEFLNKIGRNFRIGSMLSRQFVKTRVASEEGMSFTEFSYQIFQGYDWLHLHQNYGCNIQVGGNDQLGNIVSGVDLIKRILNGKQVYGLTVPIILNESGEKFAKSNGVAIWLDEAKTSPFEFYQYFLRIPDNDVERFFKIFTFKQFAEIESIVVKHKVAPEKRKAQLELAKELTLLVHGENGLKKAMNATEALYNNSVEALASLDTSDICRLFSSDQKNSGLLEMFLENETTILDLALKSGCFTNEKQAIQTIKAGGFYINHQRVSNFEESVVPGIHILPNKITLARVGKRNYRIIKWVNS